MSGSGLLLASAILLPLAMACACLSAPVRARMPHLLGLAPLPALLVALALPEGAFVFFPSPLRMTLALDRPGAILLGGAALLWSMAGLFAGSYMGRKPGIGAFCVWWLLTLAGSLGVLIVADIASFYLLFTLASLAAYGLIAHEKTPGALRAGNVYVVLALLGEAFLLAGFILLAAGSPSEANPLIRDAVATLAVSPARDAIIGLLILGCALKMGLVPLHVWLPLAHPAAPMPASAVLSGVLVKAGVIGLIRFLPFDAGLPVWGSVLAVAGLVTAFYGAAIGLAQTRPKTILAYSTVSQMGLVATIIGVALAYGRPDGRDLAAYYAMHHTLVKGALFMAVGIVAATGKARLRPVLLLTGILALALGGLPLTSGALAKLAVKPLLGYDLIAFLATLAAAGSTALMLHFTLVVAETADPTQDAAPARGQTLPWLVTAFASLLAAWWLYTPLTGQPLSGTFAPAELWKLTWPMLLGAALLMLLRRLRTLPGSVPEGDLIVLAERLAPALPWLGTRLAALDGTIRRWEPAGLLLATLTLLLGGAMLLA